MSTLGRDTNSDEEILAGVGLAGSVDAQKLIEALRARPALMLALFSNHAEDPAVDLPDVDELVVDRLRSDYPSCTRPEMLVKPKRMSMQNKRLLAHLLRRVGEPVPLLELLAVNGFHSATPRRLRELRWEQGGWPLESRGGGLDTTYVLRSSQPDVGSSAYYWLKWNIRQSDLSWEERLVALLSARLGEPVRLEDLEYVLPRTASSGKGRARTAPAALTRRIRELRERGYQVQSGLDRTHSGLGSSEYVLTTLDRLPEYERLPTKVRDACLARDGHACTQCGWSPAQGSARGRKLLEVHHDDPQRSRPERVNDPANLRTLCNVCHDAK